jgi:hypothetical protein
MVSVDVGITLTGVAVGRTTTMGLKGFRGIWGLTKIVK